MIRQLFAAVGITLLNLSIIHPAIADETNNSIIIFRGNLTKDRITLPIPELDNASSVGISYNRSLKKFNTTALEFDTGLYKYFGEQFHWEVTAAILFRFYVVKNKVSLGIGDGLSYAFQIPDIERRRHLDTSKLLNLVLLELAYDLNHNNTLAFRWHHRSGIWGLFDGVSGGSNSIELGVKYKF